jgi:hypothetical protein
VWARGEGEAERLAVELERGEGTRRGWVAGGGGDRREGCVARGDDDVELGAGEEVVEAIGTASDLKVLAGGVDFFAFGRGLQSGHEVVLVGACWEVLVVGGMGSVEEDVHGGKQSSGCSRLKLMISASECILVVLKSRMNSVKQSLNSESTLILAGNYHVKMVALTNDRLETILPINGKAGLARQLDRVYDINTHLDHALHDHIVLLQLGLGQHNFEHYMDPCTVRRAEPPRRADIGQRSADGTGRDDLP